MFVLYVILVGLIAGWATGKIMKGSGYGVLTDILLGIVGAIVGSRVLSFFGIYTTGGLIPSILVAILGAIIIVALVRMLKKARNTQRSLRKFLSELCHLLFPTLGKTSDRRERPQRALRPELLPCRVPSPWFMPIP